MASAKTYTKKEIKGLIRDLGKSNNVYVIIKQLLDDHDKMQATLKKVYFMLPLNEGLHEISEIIDNTLNDVTK